MTDSQQYAEMQHNQLKNMIDSTYEKRYDLIRQDIKSTKKKMKAFDQTITEYRKYLHEMEEVYNKTYAESATKIGKKVTDLISECDSRNFRIDSLTTTIESMREDWMKVVKDQSEQIVNNKS